MGRMVEKDLTGFIEDQGSVEILWSLVDSGSDDGLVNLFGETAAAQDDRLAGRLEGDVKEVLRPLHDDLNRFINANRKDGRHDILVELLAAVSCEAAILEAAKVRERLANSSIS